MSQLREGLVNLTRSTDSQFEIVETEILALKHQSNAMLQQMATLTSKLQKQKSPVIGWGNSTL